MQVDQKNDMLELIPREREFIVSVLGLVMGKHIPEDESKKSRSITVQHTNTKCFRYTNKDGKDCINVPWKRKFWTNDLELFDNLKIGYVYRFYIRFSVYNHKETGESVCSIWINKTYEMGWGENPEEEAGEDGYYGD